MSKPVVTASLYGLAIWIAGFVWGSIVFMVPALQTIPPIPHISRFPAISFPLLAAFAILAWLFARRFFARHGRDGASGAVLGGALAGVNFALDVLVLVIAFKNGLAYFDSASVWAAYAVLFLIPWRMARQVPPA